MQRVCRSLNRFRTSFFLAATVVSLPCVFLLVANMLAANVAGIAIFGGMLALWWLLYWMLEEGKRFAFQLCFGLVLLLWLPLLVQFGGRIHFVLENGSFERPDGLGSPLAFLSGLILEQLFFIPLSVALTSALVGLTKGDLKLFRSVQT